MKNFLESIVKEQLFEYLNQHDVIINQQSSFRAKHSCETTLNIVVDDWKDLMADKQAVVAIFLNLKRSFETVDRRILLTKLKRISIRGQSIKWFENYLTNRKQRTAIGKATSSPLMVDIGLPQGSVLAPLLFLMYVNDIPKCLSNCKIVLFADDAHLCNSQLNSIYSVNYVQADLNALYRWLCQNRLKLNRDETKYMIINRNYEGCNNIRLKINKHEIEKVDKMKYLVIIIDRKLKWDVHVDYAESNIARKIEFMYRSC